MKTPFPVGKMEKWENGKNECVFLRNRHIVQNIEKEFVQYDLLSEKVGTRIISLNAATIKRTS